MKKLKIISFILAVLFVIGTLQAEDLISFNGRYTNIVFSIKDKLWSEKHKLTFEEIQNECKKQPGNADVWYAAGLYRRFELNDRKKAGECFKKSMELAPDTLRPAFQYVDVACFRENPEELFNILTNTFHYIKESYQTVEWSGNLNNFTGSQTNYFNKLYVFIQNKKNEVPDSDYALFMISYKLGKYDIFLSCAEKLMKQTEKNHIKRNVKRIVELSGMYINNPELMVRRKRILKKCQSLYQQAIQEIEDLQNKHDNPEFYFLTSNAFVLAENQGQRIDALENLICYCMHSQKENIKRFLKTITEEKVTSFSKVSTMIRYFKRIGATNDLYSYLNKALKQIPVNKGYRTADVLHHMYVFNGPEKLTDRDGKILKATVKRFNTSYKVLNKVADIYQKHKKSYDELQCRKKTLRILKNTNSILNVKARIAVLNLEMGNPIDEKIFVDEYLKEAPKRASAAKAVSSYYLSIGKTNAALKILFKCIENSEDPYERMLAFKTILNSNWGELEEKATDFLFNYLKDNFSDIRNLSDEVFRKYFDEGLYDKSIDTFILAANNRLYIRDISKIVELPKVEFLVNKIISAGISNSYTFYTLANRLNNKKYKEAAYKLRNYFINLPTKDPYKYSAATAMIKYDLNAGNTNLCFEIVDKIDGFVEQKIVPENIPDNLYRYMLILNLTNKCDSWVEFMLKNTDNKRVANNLYSYSKWYMRLGKTNKLRNLIAKNCAANLSIYGLFSLLRVLDYTKDTNQYKSYIGIIGDRLVNANVINSYGCRYLEKINYLSRFSGENYDVEISRLLQKWFYNKKVSINKKVSMLRYAKSNQVDYINYVAKNKNKFNRRELLNIARLFINYGITNKGIEFYSYAFNKPEISDNNKINIIISIARIYINNKKYQLAENELNKLTRFNPDKQYIGFLTNVGDLYARAFKYLKAVDYYIKEINRAEKIYDIERAVLRIKDAWNYDSEIEYSKLSEINFTNKNEALNYTVKALFLLLANNTYEAEKCILKAEKKLKTDKEKHAMWNVWKNIARIIRDNDALLLAKRKNDSYRSSGRPLKRKTRSNHRWSEGVF